MTLNCWNSIHEQTPSSLGAVQTLGTIGGSCTNDPLFPPSLFLFFFLLFLFLSHFSLFLSDFLTTEYNTGTWF